MSENNSPIASCTGRILVVKDGEDGVGIKSADVVFAVYASNVAEPADDYEGWKTLFEQLTLLPDCYIWTAIKITNTNGKSWLTGKRCLGSSKDFADIKELYALGDSQVTPPTGEWKETYSPIKGKYLWSKNELTLQKVAEKVYTDPICIGYFGIDGINGMKFSIKGTAEGHFADSADIKNFAWGNKFIVDKDTKSEFAMNYPSVYTFLLTGNTSVKAAEGDAYNIDGTLWVNNGKVWVDSGSIQGPAGEAGKDAPWILLSQNQVIFESNDKGQVESSSKMIDITVMLGDNIITADCSFDFIDSNNSKFNKDRATITNTKGETETITINSEGLATKMVGGYEIPYPNASLQLQITYEEYVIKAIINIIVDTSLVDGYFRTSIHGLEAQYTEMETNIKDNSALLALHQTSINANAESIKTKVSQTEFNDKNTENSNKFSELNQTATGISQRVEAIEGDHVTKAEISTFVKKNDDGTLESGVKINADNVNISSGHALNIQGNYLIVNTTNLKVDEKGNVAIAGEINANSGTIGGLEIYNYSDTKKGLHYERGESDLYPRSRMAITRDSLLIGAEGGNAALYGATVEICPWGGNQLGSTTKAWNFSEPALTVAKNLANSPFAYDCQTVKIVSYGCDGRINEGFVVDAENGSEVVAMKAFASRGTKNVGLLASASDYAIEALNGVYAGFRLPIVNKSEDYSTISEYDTFVIFDTGTSTKHINLPQNPSEGEMHLIVQNNSASYVIETTDNRKMYGRGNDNGTTSLSVNSRNSWLQVFYHDGNWYYKQIN